MQIKKRLEEILKEQGYRKTSNGTYTKTVSHDIAPSMFHDMISMKYKDMLKEIKL